MVDSVFSETGARRMERPRWSDKGKTWWSEIVQRGGEREREECQRDTKEECWVKVMIMRVGRQSGSQLQIHLHHLAAQTFPFKNNSTRSHIWIKLETGLLNFWSHREAFPLEERTIPAFKYSGVSGALSISHQIKCPGLALWFRAPPKCYGFFDLKSLLLFFTKLTEKQTSKREWNDKSHWEVIPRRGWGFVKVQILSDKHDI